MKRIADIVSAGLAFALLFAIGTVLADTGKRSPRPGGGGASLPSQTGHAKQALVTDGTNVSWGFPQAISNGQTGSAARSMAAGSAGNQIFAGTCLEWDDSPATGKLRIYEPTCTKRIDLDSTGLHSTGIIESTLGGIKFPDGTTQTTAATASGVTNTTYFFDPATLIYAGGLATTTGANLIVNGNFTTGFQFVPTQAMSITGARFHWPAGFASTLVVALWKFTDYGSTCTAGDTPLKTQTVAVSNLSALYNVTFATPYSITGNDVGRVFAVSVWENTGTKNFGTNARDVNWPGGEGRGNGTAMISPAIMGVSFRAYNGAGLRCPSVPTSGSYFPIIPLYTVP
jgi:hypothetical protein